MSERLFYINGEWLNYTQAHSLGYTLSPPQSLTLYDLHGEPETVIKDIDTDTYYDRETLSWYNDINFLGLYSYIGDYTFYRGEHYSKYKCYSDTDKNRELRYLLYDDGFIHYINTLYTRYGLTQYKCKDIIKNRVWYDDTTSLYFDDRLNRHYWIAYLYDTEVTSYKSDTYEIKDIYEDSMNNCFYIDDFFISYNDFYLDQTNGIIRDVMYAYTIENPDETYDCYYDSFSDKYCIPHITSTWMSAVEFTSIYSTFNDFSYFYLGSQQLRLHSK
jgi:hypothetical protein